MIHVDRSRVRKSDFLDSPQIQESLDYMRKATAAGKVDSARGRLQRDLGLVNKVALDPLLELFHGKCAFCETPLAGERSTDIVPFRPRFQSVNLDGAVDPLHYWWLSYEWENLYPSCPSCSRMKGPRFPVEGPRAPAETVWAELPARERTLLLDPCRDEPERDLVFDQSGAVASSTRAGQVTIEVLGLNRTELLKARQAELEQLQKSLALLESYSGASAPPIPADLSIQSLTAETQPFAALRRQFAAEWLQSLPDDARQQLTGEQPPEVLDVLSQSIRPPDAAGPVTSADQYQSYKQETFDQFSKVKLGMDSYNLRSKKGTEGYFLRTRLIDRIEIRNFRILRDLQIRLGGDAYIPPNRPAQQAPVADPSGVPWLALIGENGSGKSSILHAVALALAGDEYRRALPLTPQEVLTYGENEGYVRLYLTGGDAPIELHYRRDSDRFEAVVPEPKVLFLAYGATRLLPRGRHRPKPGTPYARADNLLDPFVPLQDADRWLISLDEDAFVTVTRALRDLLALEEGHGFVVNRDATPPRIEVESLGDRVPLLQLSDGYQSVVALACDIMAVLLHRWKAMEVAEGIVLIDELEAHLHPRWKQQIAASLRRTFPRIQFLYTTHDPLCLQNVLPGEVHIIERDLRTGAVNIYQQDVPPGLRADQILTGWWFGLPKAIDDDTFNLLEEHRQLLLREKTPENEARRLEIEGILRLRLGGFAETSVDRLALGVAAEVISEQTREPEALTSQERDAVRATILARVKARRGA
jgi:hypothetical protein